MSGWHSLQGYLGYRSSGALGRLKGKKRLWFVFEDSSCHLVFYKSESDASSKSPMGSIEMRSAAMALNVNDPNQFVIHSAGKEYMLTAETHESTMIWLLALQAKRDAFNNRLTVYTNQTPIEYREKEEMKRKESLPSDLELRQMISRAMCAENGGPLGLLRSKSVREPRTAAMSQQQHSVRRRVVGHPHHHQQQQQQQQHQLSQQQLHPVIGHRQSIDLGRVNSFFPLEIMDVRARSAGSLLTTDSDDTDTNHAAVSPPFYGRSDENFPLTNLTLSPPTMSHASSLHGSSSMMSTMVTSIESTSELDAEDGHAGPSNLSPSGQAAFSFTNRAAGFGGPSYPETNGESGKVSLSERERIKELELLLVSAKVELANCMSKVSTLQDSLEDKNAIIQRLGHRVKESEEMKSNSPSLSTIRNNGSPSNNNSGSQEKCRILQNQNRFLNEEVLKLSRMWQQEKMNFLQQSQRMREFQVELDHLKKDYVFLLQSSIRTAGGEGPDFIEVPIYGGSKHKERVARLLEEARKVNPGLPSIEGMAKSGCHVDAFGFKHCYINEGLMLHYLCCQLHQHYNNQLVSSERNQKRWKELLQQVNATLPRTKEVKRLIRSGIPNHLRARVWGLMIQDKVKDIQESKGSHYFNQLCSMIADSEIVAQHRRQISLDLLRTMPTNVHFNESESDGVKKMQEVLQAFCLHNPEVGYCQGMNFIVGMALLFMQPEEAFWFLVAITERYFPPHYFNQNLMGAQADQDVFKNLLSIKMPNLAQHLTSMDIELSTVTLNWFLAIFFDSVPFETLLRIWDCFLYEGPKVLFRFSVALLRMSEACLLERSSTISIMRQLKACSRLCYDVEGLIRTAFEDLKPFPRRAEIVSKQACYIKTLQEKTKKRNLEREVLETKGKMLDEIDALSDTTKSVIECAAVVGQSNIWICEGHLGYGRVMEVSVTDGSMHWLNIELDSRIMCMSAIPETDVMLLGTLSRCLYAYRIMSRDLIWRTELNDTPLSVCAQQEDQGQTRIYAALADGTVAVVERSVKLLSPTLNATTEYEVFYIMVGSGPLSCLSMVERRLWCACGNRIIILHARTLDIIDQFTVSSNTLDVVSGITDSKHGVWILLRGSSTFQLWDPLNLVCKTMFDVKENKCPKVTHDGSFSALWRVTAVLPVEGMLWVGIGDGHLYVYDVQIIPSRLHSPQNVNGSEESTNTTMDMVTKRIEELYLNQCYNGSNDEGGFQDERLKQVRGRSDSGYQTVGDGSKESSTGQQDQENLLHDGSAVSQRNSGEFADDKNNIRCETTANLGEQRCDTTTIMSSSETICTDRPRSSESGGIFSKMWAVGMENISELNKLRYSLRLQSSSQSEGSRTSSKGSDGALKQHDSVDLQDKSVTSQSRTTLKVSEDSEQSTVREDRRWIRRTDPCCRLNHSMSTYELASGALYGARQAKTSPSSISSSPPPPSSYKPLPVCRRSYDDVAHLLGGSGDSLFSSPTCDSFDFDDVFVSYTEDERWLSVNGQLCNRPPSTASQPVDSGNRKNSLIPRFIILTDEGSTGGDGGSSSGGAGSAADKQLSMSSCKQKCGSSRHGGVHHARAIRGKMLSTSSHSLRRKKDRLDVNNVVHKRSSSMKHTLSPPLLIVGALADNSNDNREDAERLNRPEPSSGSSLDDLSSVSHVEYDSVQDVAGCGVGGGGGGSKRNVEHLTISNQSKGSNCWKGSDSGSFVSFSESDIPYSVELTLKEKQKIADKPVKCILSTPSDSAVISCAGSCNDAKSVLKWTVDKSKRSLILWNSKAVVCLHSPDSDRNFNIKPRTPSPSSSSSLVHATSNLVGSGLARVQNIISNLGSELPIS